MLRGIYLYIDPSTGSMLFAILIGIIGALVYSVKSWFVKIRFYLSSGKLEKAEEGKLPIVFFADNKRYWSIFEPVIRILSERGIRTVYMTASKDDPALDIEMPMCDRQFIGDGNRAYAKMNLLNAHVVVSTTPGLDVYQWKRSKSVDYYIHMLHACDGVLAYRMFGIDYYDAVLLSGQFMYDNLRELESVRGIANKETEFVGIPYMDEMLRRVKEAKPLGNHGRTVLLAPSWGPSSILNKFGEKFINKLVSTGYHVIVRPHPQSFSSETDMINRLMKKYPESEKFEWNRDNDNFDVLHRADILISDFSGVTFEFSLVHDKPIIYADVEFDRSPYDAWWLPDTDYWTFTALPRIGMKLTEENFDSIKDMIDECIEDERFALGRKEVIAECWMYQGEGATRAADYIEGKYKALINREDVSKETEK